MAVAAAAGLVATADWAEGEGLVKGVVGSLEVMEALEGAVQVVAGLVKEVARGEEVMGSVVEAVVVVVDSDWAAAAGWATAGAAARAAAAAGSTRWACRRQTRRPTGRWRRRRRWGLAPWSWPGWWTGCTPRAPQNWETSTSPGRCSTRLCPGSRRCPWHLRRNSYS